MEYREGDEIREFVKRTRQNLEVIRAFERENKGSAFEFTQLVNSMLGLLVFPQQKYVAAIPKTPLSDLRNVGWRFPTKIEGDFEPDNLHDLFCMLRNGIAHFNVKFISDSNRQLSGLQIWNQRNKKTPPNWKAEITKDDLEDLTNRFVELLLENAPVEVGD